MKLCEILMGDIPRILPKVAEIRRHVHMYPELSGEERETSAYVCRILEEHGISYTVLPDGSGIVARVMGNAPYAIGIRAELDALPMTEQTGLDYASRNEGVMHACGHDMHLAVALGFLLMLKPHEDKLTCGVAVFFQPAEETVGGADEMIRRGCLEDPPVHRVFGFHVTPSLSVGDVQFLPGVMNAAVTDFELKVMGKSCHGAHPEQGVDAIVAGAAIVSALQTVVSRNIAPTDSAVVTVGTFDGGTAGNIVAGEVSMNGTLRALDSAVMTELKGAVSRVCEDTAAGYGARVQLDFTTEYPPLCNDADLTAKLLDRAGQLLGKDKTHLMSAPSLGADDFAFFCQKVPGCYFNVGCRTEHLRDGQILHSPLFAPDERCFRTALQMLCLLIEE